MEVRFSWNAKNVHLGVRYIPMGLHRTPKVGLFSCVFRPLYSYRDYFTSSNVRNIFRQCGFFGLSGAKSVEQAHFIVKGLLTVYHLERMIQNSSDVSQNPAQTYDRTSPSGGGHEN